MTYKIWVDDVRVARHGYIWIKKTNEALCFIVDNWDNISEVALDHDAGVYQEYGGDYVRILDEIERLSRRGKEVPFAFSIHSQNPVGVENMRRIIQKNGWTEVR
jgi:hypothetical protein